MTFSTPIPATKHVAFSSQAGIASWINAQSPVEDKEVFDAELSALILEVAAERASARMLGLIP